MDRAALPSRLADGFGSRPGTVCFILALAIGGAALSVDADHPKILMNTTPSEPVGFYMAVKAPIVVGALIAFKAPAAAFPYADARLGYLHHEPLLKAVAAGPGDMVCTTPGRLRIDGHDLAPIATRDGEGRALPQWRGCRAMRDGEWFVYSPRVSNSFDSRYFGPVARADIKGVFAPVLARQETP